MSPAETVEDAFRELYESTSRRVYAFARRHTDAEVAEQIMSDTFLAAWRHWDELPEPAMPWLLVTARNLVRMHYRGSQRRDRLVDTVAFHTSVTTAPAPEDEVVERHVMLEALRRLSDDDREALLLIAWDGLSHDDAAQVVGITRNAFAQRVSRARARLTTLATSAPLEGLS